jgi:hypothetical protein
MSLLIFKAIKPFLRKNSMDYLQESNVREKQEKLVVKKLRMMGSSNLGKSIGVQSPLDISKLPLTGYEFYTPFYKNPKEGDFMYPLTEYVKTHTSGTMGKPKVYMAPQRGFKENLKRAALSLFFICTHDGEKSRLDIGDTIYANLPGGSFLASFMGDSFRKNQSSILKLVPENSNQMSFEEKVDYFVHNHQEVDVAYMTVTSFLDDIVPRVEDQIYLKGFITQDTSAGPMKEEIKKASGNYPKTLYASTESMLSGLPSIQYPGGFFMDWRVIYPEFIEEDDALSTDTVKTEEYPEIVPMMDVKAGKRYQLIATPLFNDITRYVMPDIFECMAIGDNILGTDIPIFKYYTRSDRLMVLHNFTRISEEEMISLMKNAGLPMVDFTARKELDGAREYMHVYLELNQSMPYEEAFEKLNAALLEFDKDWRDLSDFMSFTPLKLTLLPKGTFHKFLNTKEGMARIARIGMREERFNMLMEQASTG